MKKTSPTPELEAIEDANPWDAAPVDPAETKTVKQQVKETIVKHKTETEYDLEGLMNDFPTATELERFVYDQTGYTLNLKGRAQKLKYQVAMDVLNGEPVDAKFTSGDNPYIDRADLVPVEDLRPVPPRDADLPSEDQIQNQFYTPFIPHPDPEFRAVGKKCHCTFRKYNDGTISYEINGPWEKKESGTKIDKYGRTRPEIIKWIGAATGEQMVQREDGTLTPTGRRLRTMMQSMRINAGNIWDTFVDRDFGQFNQEAIVDPWGTDTRA
jgi:hypothetical protein